MSETHRYRLAEQGSPEDAFFSRAEIRDGTRMDVILRARSGDKAAFERILNAYGGMLLNMASLYWNAHPLLQHYYSFDDVHVACVTGLWRAVLEFDLKKGRSFNELIQRKTLGEITTLTRNARKLHDSMPDYVDGPSREEEDSNRDKFADCSDIGKAHAQVENRVSLDTALRLLSDREREIITIIAERGDKAKVIQDLAAVHKTSTAKMRVEISRIRRKLKSIILPF